MKYLRFINDLVFQYVFGNEKNKRVLIALLNAILNLKGEDKIKDINFLNPITIRGFFNEKQSILDIKAQDEKGIYYNIEMQVVAEKYYIERVLYYFAKLYGHQLIKNDKYERLQKSISISILNYSLLKEERDILNTYRLLNLKSHRQLSDHYEFHFIELSKFNKNKPKKLQTPFEKWLYMLKFDNIYIEEDAQLPENLKNEEGIELAVEALRYANGDSQLRWLMEAREKRERDIATRLFVGREEGKEEGRKEGRKEGQKEGRKEGRKEGIKEGKFETAKNMLKEGMTISLISKFTGLSEEEISKIHL